MNIKKYGDTIFSASFFIASIIAGFMISGYLFLFSIGFAFLAAAHFMKAKQVFWWRPASNCQMMAP